MTDANYKLLKNTIHSLINSDFKKSLDRKTNDFLLDLCLELDKFKKQYDLEVAKQ